MTGTGAAPSAGADFAALAASAIDGIAEAEPWRRFVHLLRCHFGASHANIIFRRADLKQAFIAEDYADPATQGKAHASYRPEDDPIPYYRLEPFQVHAIDDFLSEGGSHPFMARFLRPLGMAGMLICRVVTPSGLQAWISVTHPDPDALGEQQRRELGSIARLFAQALALFGTYQAAVDQRDAYARVVRARATGMVRLDQAGKVLHIDEAAATWLGEGGSLQVAAGRLRAVRAADRVRLNRALGNILAGTSEEELLALGEGGDGLEVLMFRVSEAYEPAWLSATRAILYVRRAGQEALPTPQRVRTLLGLSRREAALAVLLARGLTLAQAAQDLGISELTARAYLRQIFARTGVSRQADLIRQIQSSIAGVQ